MQCFLKNPRPKHHLFSNEHLDTDIPSLARTPQRPNIHGLISYVLTPRADSFYLSRLWQLGYWEGALRAVSIGSDCLMCTIFEPRGAGVARPDS